MHEFTTLRHSRFFRILHGLNKENMSDNKVAMLSEVDMSAVERLRKQTESQTGIRPSYTAMVVKAVSLALRRHPHANRIPVGFLGWRRLIQLHIVDMTVAVERDLPGIEQGVFAATIRHTDEKDLAVLTRELRDLANATPETCSRWRQFKWIVEHLPAPLALWVLSVPRWFARLWVEHRGGAVMISSPAKYGVDVMVGAWPWPLGFSFGFVKERPVVVDHQVVVRPTMTLTMSFDRRLMAGAPAARFFQTVCENLEKAEVILPLAGTAISPSEEYVGDIPQHRRSSGRLKDHREAEAPPTTPSQLEAVSSTDHPASH